MAQSNDILEGLFKNTKTSIYDATDSAKDDRLNTGYDFSQDLMKKNLSPLLGLEGYTFLLKMLKDNNVDIPIVSIGGIEISDIKEILSTGVHGIAVSSLISNADNIEQNTKQLIEEFNLLKC